MVREPIQITSLMEPDKDNPYGYIYVITNKLNGRMYVGQHYSKTFDPCYWGRGTEITADIKIYGVENFTRKICEWVRNKSEADCKERYWIELLGTFRGNGYNLTPGGGGCGAGVDNHAYGKPSPLKGTHISEERKLTISVYFTGRQFSKSHLEKLSAAAKLFRQTCEYSDEYRRQCSERNKGENNPMYGRRGENSPLYGRKMPPDQRQKILDWAASHVNPNARTLYQYDPQGNFVKSYSSVATAYSEPEKYEASTLIKRCRFKQGHRYIPYKGYYWSYAPPINGLLPPLEVSIKACEL